MLSRFHARSVAFLIIVATFAAAQLATSANCTDSACGASGFSVEIHNPSAFNRTYEVRFSGCGCSQETTCPSPSPSCTVPAGQTVLCQFQWTAGGCPPSTCTSAVIEVESCETSVDTCSIGVNCP